MVTIRIILSEAVNKPNIVEGENNSSYPFIYDSYLFY